MNKQIKVDYTDDEEDAAVDVKLEKLLGKTQIEDNVSSNPLLRLNMINN